MPLPKRPGKKVVKKPAVTLPAKPTLRSSSEAPNEANVGKAAVTPAQPLEAPKPLAAPAVASTWKPMEGITGTVTTRATSPVSNMKEVPRKPKGFAEDPALLEKVRAALLPLAKECITLRQVAGCVRFLIEEMESKQ